MNWNLKSLALAVSAVLLSSTGAWAGACTSSTLDTYETAGFSCSIGDVTFDNFTFSATAGTPHSGSLINGNDSINVTPQSTGGQIGLSFSNLGLKVSPNDDSFNVIIQFRATDAGGAFDGWNVRIDDAGATATTYAIGAFGVVGLSDGVCAENDSALAHCGPFSGNTLSGALDTASGSFADTTTLDLQSEGVAGAIGTSGDLAVLNAYTVLLSTESNTTSVPEPASLTLFGAGLAALWMRRRRKGPSPIAQE
jgi:PEP-CTERM motif